MTDPESDIDEGLAEDGETPAPWADLGRRIKTAREARGLTQVELANKLDIGRKQMSRYENGHQAPPRDKARMLEAELGIAIVTELEPEAEAPLDAINRKLDRLIDLLQPAPSGNLEAIGGRADLAAQADRLRAAALTIQEAAAAIAELAAAPDSAKWRERDRDGRLRPESTPPPLKGKERAS